MDQGSSLIFDFNSQAGVMSLLASIRASNLSPADKNELRDLVFLYTNGGGDVSVRIALEQKLVTHKIIPTVSNATSAAVAPAPVLPFGSSRPAPVFNPTVVQSTPTPAVVPVPVAVPAPQAPVVAPIAVAPAPVAAPVAAAPVPIPPVTAPVYVEPTQMPVVAAPVAVAPQPAPVYVAPPVAVAPAPVAVPVAAPIPVVAPVAAPLPAVAPVVAPIPVAPVMPVPAPTVAQAVPPVVPPQPAPVISAAGVNYLDRIREIKVAVNSKVGNPVNLVDINNEVGREYMNALLDAMKRLSGGAAGGIEIAMQRLETAYKAVEVAVAAHNQAGGTAAAVPVPAPVPTPNPVETASVVDTPAVQNYAPAPIPTPVPPALMAPEPIMPVAEIPVPPAPPEPIVATDDGAISGFAAPIVEGPSGFNAPAPEAVPQPPSLASEQKMRTPLDLPDPTSIASSATGDPLRTREIDDGLSQLLSDWSLFKKSGLFGTGPKGREHPLFKKLSGLQIPLVLAGRFEGSTQEIKQSITDYMNGWRYEQGIIYEQGETFEHYLRRVIKQILDLQKKRKPA